MSDSKISIRRKVLIAIFLPLFLVGGLLALDNNIAGAFTYWFFLGVVFTGLWFILA